VVIFTAKGKNCKSIWQDIKRGGGDSQMMSRATKASWRILCAFARDGFFASLKQVSRQAAKNAKTRKEDRQPMLFMGSITCQSRPTRVSRILSKPPWVHPELQVNQSSCNLINIAAT
jgi:hypothetical protein